MPAHHKNKKKTFANPMQETVSEAQPVSGLLQSTTAGGQPPAPTQIRTREDILAAAVKKAHALGFDEGCQKTKQNFLNELSFNTGVRNIIAIAENHLAKALGLKGRQDLTTCDRIPSWWLATLISDIWYKPGETEKVGKELNN